MHSLKDQDNSLLIQIRIKIFNHFFVEEAKPYRIIVNVYDALSAERFMKELDLNTYVASYEPFNRNTQDTSFGILMKIGSIASIFIVSSILFMLVGFVFKQMIKTRRKDFAIFRSVGANQNFISKLMITEQFIQLLLGSVMTFILIFVLYHQSDEVMNILKICVHFRLLNYFLQSLVL